MNTPELQPVTKAAQACIGPETIETCSFNYADNPIGLDEMYAWVLKKQLDENVQNNPYDKMWFSLTRVMVETIQREQAIGVFALEELVEKHFFPEQPTPKPAELQVLVVDEKEPAETAGTSDEDAYIQSLEAVLGPDNDTAPSRDDETYRHFYKARLSAIEYINRVLRRTPAWFYPRLALSWEEIADLREKAELPQWTSTSSYMTSPE